MEILLQKRTINCVKRKMCSIVQSSPVGQVEEVGGNPSQTSQCSPGGRGAIVHQEWKTWM